MAVNSQEACIACGQVGYFKTRVRGDNTRECICGALYHGCTQHPHIMVDGPWTSTACSCEVPIGSCPRCKTYANHIKREYDGTLHCPRCEFVFHMCEAHIAQSVEGRSPGDLSYRSCSCGAESRAGNTHEKHLVNMCRDWKIFKHQ
jgi:hypothetical protein